MIAALVSSRCAATQRPRTSRVRCCTLATTSAGTPSVALRTAKAATCWPSGLLVQRHDPTTASGRTGEPVAPKSGSGESTKRNSWTASRASSSRSIVSMM